MFYYEDLCDGNPIELIHINDKERPPPPSGQIWDPKTKTYSPYIHKQIGNLIINTQLVKGGEVLVKEEYVEDYIVDSLKMCLDAGEGYNIFLTTKIYPDVWGINVFYSKAYATDNKISHKYTNYVNRMINLRVFS